MKITQWVVSGLLLLSSLIACAQTITTISGGQQTMKLTSPAFTTGENIPVKYTCDGDNMSPPLHWEGAPDLTKSFALIIEDPDAPNGTFIHWILFNIPQSISDLTEKLSTVPAGALQGINSRNKNSYVGPCPPDKAHRYIFKLYALDTLLSLSKDVTRGQLESAMEGHVLVEADLVGIYKRQ